LLGSVTSRVLRETKTPVVTVSPDVRIPTTIETVLCPVNFSDAARAALEESASVAEAFGARLVVMHVLDKEPPLQSHVNETFAAWVDPVVRDRTSYEHIICHGDAAVRVAEAADMIAASLVVVGAQQVFLGCRTLLGSSSAQIIRACRRPVLTVMCPPAA
jgi:nucleotide-binding universal stress UspA family protein